MGDKPWKQAERRCAAILGGARFWSNSGESFDVESETHLGQVKEVAQMSLAELTRLVIDTERDAAKRGKRGLVMIKLRGGKGNVTPTLIVQSAESWKKGTGR